jgi:hypothetical protein
MTQSTAQAATLTPADAFVCFANHCIACPTCNEVDEQGWNLNLPCAEQDRLNEAYQQARKGVRG